jgi:hypothetical protein
MNCDFSLMPYEDSQECADCDETGWPSMQIGLMSEDLTWVSYYGRTYKVFTSFPELTNRFNALISSQMVIARDCFDSLENHFQRRFREIYSESLLCPNSPIDFNETFKYDLRSHPEESIINFCFQQRFVNPTDYGKKVVNEINAVSKSVFDYIIRMILSQGNSFIQRRDSIKFSVICEMVLKPFYLQLVKDNLYENAKRLIEQLGEDKIHFKGAVNFKRYRLEIVASPGDAKLLLVKMRIVITQALPR